MEITQEMADEITKLIAKHGLDAAQKLADKLVESGIFIQEERQDAVDALATFFGQVLTNFGNETIQLLSSK